MEPRIQYAKTADGVDIAYATEGEGPPLVYLSIPAGAHVQRAWAMFPFIVPREAFGSALAGELAMPGGKLLPVSPQLLVDDVVAAA